MGQNLLIFKTCADLFLTSVRMPLDDEAPPMPIGARKARFSVDLKENYIEWMDFSLYLVQDQYGGMTLYDVRFKGERILYELGIQEIVAHYVSCRWPSRTSNGVGLKFWIF